MAYWWVCQGKSFWHESQNGYLWAPKARGSFPHHWKTLEAIKAGDTIFSYAKKSIVAVLVAISDAHDAPRPPGFNSDAENGTRVDASYTILPHSLPLATITPQLRTLLPERYSPINKNGIGVQGYCFALPAAAGTLLEREIGGARGR